MSNIIIPYNRNNITFKNEVGSVYANATDIGRLSGKVPYRWLELPSNQEFINALSINGKNVNWIITKRGRPDLGGGTLFSEDIAI